MYNFFIIEKNDIQKFIDTKMLDDINELFKKAIVLLYEKGKLYLYDDYKNLHESQTRKLQKIDHKQHLLEVDFTNKGHFSVVEVYANKFSRKKVVCELEIKSIVALDSQLDNYVSGICRMFNLPYFGNDFYLSTLLNDQVFQSISIKQNNIKVLPFMWFYFYDFKKLNTEMQSFIDNNKDKRIILSPIDRYCFDKGSINEISSIEEIEDFVVENTKSHITTKYIMKAFPRNFKRIYCVNNTVIGKVSDDLQKRICDIFLEVFKALGQETFLFGVEFAVCNDEIYVTRLLSIIDLYVNKDYLKELLSKTEFKTFVEYTRLNLKQIVEEREKVYYANNRRQFVFQSKILDDVEGGKL